MSYLCERCGAEVAGIAAARKHAKQGHRTQREAFYAGELHALTLQDSGPAVDWVAAPGGLQAAAFPEAATGPVQGGLL